MNKTTVILQLYCKIIIIIIVIIIIHNKDLIILQ